MLKKFLLGFAIAGGLIASAPTASAEPDPRCLAAWGCTYVMDNDGGYRDCPDPGIYALCDV
jgi:hypothetical protein